MLSCAELLCVLLLMCCADRHEHCGVALRCVALYSVVLFYVKLRWIMVLIVLYFSQKSTNTYL